MSFLPERGCPGSVQAECRGREQLTRLRSGQPPLPGAAGAGRGGGGAPGAAGAGHPAQPLPRSPPFISPRLAPARSPGPSTAPSLAPPPPPPSRGDPALCPGVANAAVRLRPPRSPVCRRVFARDLRCACPLLHTGPQRVPAARGSGTGRLRRCAQGPGPRPATPLPGPPTSYLRDLGLHTQCILTLGFSPGKWRL